MRNILYTKFFDKDKIDKYNYNLTSNEATDEYSEIELYNTCKENNLLSISYLEYELEEYEKLLLSLL